MHIGNRSDKLQLAISAFALLFLWGAIFYLLGIVTAVWSGVLNRWGVVFPTFLCICGALGILILIAIIRFRTISGKLLSILLLLGCEALFILYYIIPEKVWCLDFPSVNNGVVFLGLIAGGIALLWNLFSLIHALVHRIQKTHNQEGLLKLGPLRPKVRITLAVALITCTALGVGFATNWFDPYYHVVVPAAGQVPPMQFSFWSTIAPSDYNSTQWYQLNAHHAIIVAYTPWDYENNKPFPINVSFQWAQAIQSNYSSIQLIFPLYGSYYDWKTIEDDTYNYLNAISTLGLTNVIGFEYDIERAWDNCSHNVTLLQECRASLQRCFAAIRANHPTYRIDNTDGLWMMFDNLPLGGSFELYKQHPLMSLADTWTGYAWQLYRGNAVDPASDPDSTNMYERILSSVQYVGASKTIPLLGMTGVGDYGSNNCSVNNPTAVVPCNFAGVIRDCRIAHALGVPEVGFYTLSNASTYNGVYYPSMFQAYGEDFLDVLNASVNGLAEPLVLTIPGNTAWQTTVGYWWEDVVYSISFPVMMILMGVPLLLVIVICRKIESQPHQS